MQQEVNFNMTSGPAPRYEQDQKQGEVTRALTDLHSTIGRVNDLARALVRELAPVMRQDHPVPDPQAEVAQLIQSPLGGAITEMDRTLTDVEGVLRAILARLEL